MERPLRVSKFRPQEHKNGGLVLGEAFPLLPLLGGTKGDVSVFFGCKEVDSLVLVVVVVSIGVGDASFGSTAIALGILPGIVEERGMPGVVEQPSAASSDKPESAVESADLEVVRLIWGGRLLL